MKKREKLFTIIELLIVISIVLILVSILIPALAKARGKGYSVKCLNNLKQQGTASIMYANDNNDWLFTGQHVVYKIAPYLGYQGDPRYERGKEMGNAKRNGVFNCPLEDSRTKDSAPSMGWYKTNYILRYDSDEVDGAANAAPESDITLFKVYYTIRLKHTRYYIHRGDAGIENSWLLSIYKGGRLTPAEQWKNFGFIHVNRTNILFIDAHVETLDHQGIYNVMKNLKLAN